jgi:hypothetical protein
VIAQVLYQGDAIGVTKLVVCSAGLIENLQRLLGISSEHKDLGEQSAYVCDAIGNLVLSSDCVSFCQRVIYFLHSSLIDAAALDEAGSNLLQGRDARADLAEAGESTNSDGLREKHHQVQDAQV